MSRNLLVAIIILIVIVIIALIFIASRQNTLVVVAPTPVPNTISQPTTTIIPSASPSASVIQTQQISIKDLAFNPSLMTIKVGTILTWTNNDNTVHTVTSDPNGSVFNSQMMQSGDTFSLVFNRAGTFPYLCSIHPDMRGTVTVTP